MSNCTVNNCVHTANTWSGKVPAVPTTPGTSTNPMCDNTLSGLHSDKNTRAGIVNDCRGDNSCFTNLKCIDGETCPTIFNTLMKNGWGDKDKEGSVLYNINHASPENLRDQLKFELCRRASCIPVASTGLKTGWEWFGTMVTGTWYKKLLFGLAILPTMWIVLSLLYNSFIKTSNNYPTVLGGGKNNSGSKTSAAVYLAGVVLILLFCTLIFSKYSAEKSFGIIFVLLAALAPIVSFGQNSGSGISTLYFAVLILVKLAGIGGTIAYLKENLATTESTDNITGVKTAAWGNGIMFVIIGLFVGILGLRAEGGAKGASIISALALVGAGITYAAIGSKSENDKADSGNVSTMLWVGLALYIVLYLSALFPTNNGVMVLACTVIALLMFVQLDNTNVLNAIKSDTKISTIAVVMSIFLTIGVVMFIKGNGGAFSGNMKYYLTAATYFSVYCTMSGIQTFIGFILPPVCLSLLVLERVLSSVFTTKLGGVLGLPKGTYGSQNTWSFLFTGRMLATTFTETMKKLGITDPTALFTEKSNGNRQSIGAPNAQIFF